MDKKYIAMILGGTIFSRMLYNFNVSASFFEKSGLPNNIQAEYDLQFPEEIEDFTFEGKENPPFEGVSNGCTIIELGENVSHIPLNSKFDALKGVKAYDLLEGDLTDAIIVAGDDLDTSQTGAHQVTYAVINRDGFVTVKNKTVIIK